MTETAGSNAKIRVGVIGLGGGASMMVPKFAATPGFAIAAAADIDNQVLATFGKDFPNARLWTSAEDLCASDGVDFVYVATPNMLHRDHTLAAVENGKHVLVEKPMTISIEDATAMVEAAERNGVLLGVNVANSFDPRVQKLREFTQTQELGELRMVHSWRYTDWLYRPRAPEELTPELGGGVLWRQGGHQLDLLRTIGGGLVRSVRGIAQIWDPGRRVTGAHTAFLEFQNGAACTAVFSGHEHFDSREMVFGFSSDNWEPSTDYAKARRALVGHGDDAGWETAQKHGDRYGSGRRGNSDTPWARSTPPWLLGGPVIASYDHADVKTSPRGLVIYDDHEQREIPLQTVEDCRDFRLRAFRDSIWGGTPLACDGRWGRATVEVLVAIERSGRERREVNLVHQVSYAS